jgi:excisionase family DNA binding protein
MPEPVQDDILDVPGACELLKIKERTLRSWIKTHSIPYAKIGGLLRFRRSALMAWVAERETRKGSGDP